MEWVIYFLGVVDGLSKLFCFFAATAITGFVVGVIMLFVSMDTDYDANLMRRAKRLLKISVSVGLISALLATFIPSSKTLAAMYVLPAIAKNEQLQNFAGNSLKAPELLSKQWVKDLTPSDESHI